MFKSILKILFFSSKKNKKPNYYTFEESRKAEQEIQDEAKAELQDSIPLPPLKFTSIEEIHQKAFYDFLFGQSSSIEQHDELSLYVTKEIQKTLSTPKHILESLPLLPPSLIKVIEQLNDKEFDTEVLIELIQKEPIISVKVIELANSSYYNRGNKVIIDLKSAFMLLGTNGLMEGVINGFISNLTPQSALYFRQYGNKIWQHCFTTGEIAKTLISNSPHEQESGQGYLIGLLCNLGDMIIYQLLIEAFTYVHPDYRPSSFAFKEIMSKSSKRLTYFIAKQWNLPSAILDALALQEKLTKSSMLSSVFSRRPIACYVYEANIISEVALRLEQQEISNEEFEEVKSALVFSKEAKQYLENLFNDKSDFNANS
jgi:HD-like signal output (HDOD) protein